MLPADVELYLCPMRDGLVTVAGAQDDDSAGPLSTHREPTPATDVDTGHDDTDTDTGTGSFDMFSSGGEDTDQMSQLRADVESDTYYGSGVVPEFVGDIEE